MYMYTGVENGWGHAIIGRVQVGKQTMVEWSTYHLTIAMPKCTSGHSQWTAPMTLFMSITMLCGTENILGIFFVFNVHVGDILWNIVSPT